MPTESGVATLLHNYEGDFDAAMRRYFSFREGCVAQGRVGAVSMAELVQLSEGNKQDAHAAMTGG